jgi:MFS family permease
MPFTAALSDIFGRPLCLLTSLAIFTVGTVLCCVAKSLSVLLVGRSVQGIGGGGIIILGLVIFTDIVPLRHRSKYYGIMYATSPLHPRVKMVLVCLADNQSSVKVPGLLEHVLDRLLEVL